MRKWPGKLWVKNSFKLPLLRIESILREFSSLFQMKLHSSPNSFTAQQRPLIYCRCQVTPTLAAIPPSRPTKLIQLWIWHGSRETYSHVEDSVNIVQWLAEKVQRLGSAVLFCFKVLSEKRCYLYALPFPLCASKTTSILCSKTLCFQNQLFYDSSKR